MPWVTLSRSTESVSRWKNDTRASFPGQLAVTKSRRPGGLSNRRVSPPSSGGWTSEVEVSSGPHALRSPSGEHSSCPSQLRVVSWQCSVLLGSWMRCCTLRSHAVFPLWTSVSAFPLFLRTSVTRTQAHSHDRNLVNLCKDPSSKEGHFPGFRRLGLQHLLGVRGQTQFGP